MQVTVQNLKRYYAETRAVDDISFSFKSGDVFAFVGPNGAGKTTTLRMMATLDEPSGGDIFIDGISVKERPEHIRQNIGYVPDSLPTHSDITVFEYLDFYGRAFGLRGSDLKGAVRETMDFTGLENLQNKLLKSLSKGMKQRVSVGRALIHNPSILIMDEPAAGLDPRARIEFRELVSLLAEMDKAILISSHILTELTEVCNGVVIIEKGKLLKSGSLDGIRSESREHHTVSIKALNGIDELEKALLESANVINSKPSGNEMFVDLSGEAEGAAQLLAELISKGIRITEFRSVQDDLEDMFMRITKGETQ